MHDAGQLVEPHDRRAALERVRVAEHLRHELVVAAARLELHRALGERGQARAGLLLEQPPELVLAAGDRHAAASRSGVTSASSASSVTTPSASA